MDKQHVIFRDLGNMDYKEAWDYQEKLLLENAQLKSEFVIRNSELVANGDSLTFKESVTRAALTLPAGLPFTSHVKEG